MKQETPWMEITRVSNSGSPKSGDVDLPRSQDHNQCNGLTNHNQCDGLTGDGSSQQRSLVAPLTNFPASKGLGTKILELIKNSSPDQISQWGDWIDIYSQDSKNGQSLVKKKKNQNRDHPPLSLVTTRSRVKADVEAKLKTPGRRTLNQTLQKETRKNLVDGSQRTIKEYSRSKK